MSNESSKSGRIYLVGVFLVGLAVLLGMFVYWMRPIPEEEVIRIRRLRSAVEAEREIRSHGADGRTLTDEAFDLGVVGACVLGAVGIGLATYGRIRPS